MTTCSVPNCKLKSEIKFNSPRNEQQLNLWKKILKIKENKFFICDQHFEDRFIRTKKLGVTICGYPSLYISSVETGSSEICQCCMKSFVSKFFNKNDEFFVISEGFQTIFRDVIGCEIQQGIICLKCHDYIKNFASFRENIRNSQKIRENIQENDSKNYFCETEEEEFHVEMELEGAKCLENNEEPQFEILQYEDEEYVVEMKDEIENSENEYEGIEESSFVEIKQEKIENKEFEGPEHQLDASSSQKSENITENLRTIIKIEPIEDEELQNFEYQNILETFIKSEPGSSTADTLPKISNPRSLTTKKEPKSKKRKENSEISENPPKVFKMSRVVPPHKTPVTPKFKKYLPEPSDSSSMALKCQYCPERFENCDLIFEHIQEKHKFWCPTCNKSFPFKITLIQHQVSEHKGSAKEHLGRRPVTYRHSCAYCNMRLTSSEDLEAHMRQKHNINLRRIGSDGEEGKSSSLSNRILNKFKPTKPGYSGSS